MEIPSRSAIEFKFARELSRLTTRQRNRLAKYLGFPPDLRNVPDSFWKEVEEENRGVIFGWWQSVFLASAIYHGLDAAQAEIAAQQAAERKAAEVAAGYVATTQKRLDNAADAWLEKIQNDNMRKGELLQDLVKILGPRRVETVVVDNVTNAQTAGGEFAAQEQGLISPDDLWLTWWRIRPGDGAVCQICAPLHRTTRDFWSRYFPEGPSAHPECRCIIEYRNNPSGKNWIG